MRSSTPLVVEANREPNENFVETIDGDINKNVTKFQNANNRSYELVWRNIFAISGFHLGAIYGLYLAITSAKIYTSIFGECCMPYSAALELKCIFFAFFFLLVLVYGLVSVLGITCGVHRLWSHRSYKAKLPLQILLMIFQTISFQYSIINWARDHRLHHKFSETDADPHNALRYVCSIC